MAYLSKTLIEFNNIDNMRIWAKENNYKIINISEDTYKIAGIEDIIIKLWRNNDD